MENESWTKAVQKKNIWDEYGIFWDFPYWKDQLLRHNINAMHVVVEGDTTPREINNNEDSRVLMESDNVSSKSINPSISGLPRRKTRKVCLIKDLLDDKPETKASYGPKTTGNEESSSKKESVGDRKRKADLPENYYVRRKLRKASETSKNVSKIIDADQGDQELTDSEFDRDPIKGRQKKKKFQVVDECVQESVHEDDADFGTSALPTHVQSLLKDQLQA